MSNKLRKSEVVEKSFYPVMLDGEEYQLRFGHVALEYIEAVTDKNWMLGLVDLMGGKVTYARIFLQAGLMLKHPELTKGEVIELMEESDPGEIMEALINALEPECLRVQNARAKADERTKKKIATATATEDTIGQSSEPSPSSV